MSWFRDWLNRAKQPDHEASTERQQPGEPHVGADETGGHHVHIREAERRQLRRLLKRKDDLSYDLQQAEQALEPENQWTERIDQLNAAIDQALADRKAVEPKPDDRPRPQLSETPIEIIKLREEEPAEISLEIGTTVIRYEEAIDWAERGHQVTLPELRRVSGDVESLLPVLNDEGVTQELREHLLHSLATLANQALERAARGEAMPSMTLADLTRPCPTCGGWLDQKGRCPVCTEVDWKRQEIETDLRRLRKERDDMIQDLERTRDRLPIVRRQLQETEADIGTLRAKGVEPAG